MQALVGLVLVIVGTILGAVWLFVPLEDVLKVEAS